MDEQIAYMHIHLQCRHEFYTKIDIFLGEFFFFLSNELDATRYSMKDNINVEHHTHKTHKSERSQSIQI